MINKLGLRQITIPLPFKLDHVHCFMAEGENGYTIIDTGLNDERTQKIWQRELANKDVEHIIITHLHPDHCGFAGNLQKQTSATMSMTKTDYDALAKIWTEEALPLLKQDYDKANIDEKIADGILVITEDFRPFVTPIPKVTHYLQDGERVLIGKNEYEVIFTPGHSAGLVCFYQKENNVLLSTDHILPKITPNIAYWFYGDKNPLKSYEQSLQKVKRLNVEYVIPSHGEPFYDANKRIDEIWSHHEERFIETLDAIKGGASVYQVCETLFSNKLSLYDYQFAIGETIAHLEYLRYEDECIRELEKGKWIYYRN